MSNEIWESEAIVKCFECPKCDQYNEVLSQGFSSFISCMHCKTELVIKNNKVEVK